MRMPKWLLFTGNVILFVVFAYVSISSYSNSAAMWWLWGIISLIYGYMSIDRFIKGRKEGWASKEVVEDQRTWNIRLVSCFIAFIYILLFLTGGVITFYLGYLTIDPVIFMFLVLVSSIAVFAISQILQFAIK